ncbi:MAG: ABC transporter permease [Varibaculum cambriense]|nr:ABC transporter permease [Varibaculum cambriense]
MSVSTDFTRPGTSHGLFEVVRKQYLLQLLVHKELRVRYRGSILGMLWSYAKPATQFLVFYFAIGVFMGMNRNITNYVVYMFAGVVAVNYFSEIFGNCTRSLVQNQDLVKKIYLPRQLFPVSSVWVAFVHFVPQVVILIIGSLIFGWRPGINNLLAVLLAFVVLTIFSLGLGLLGGAFNVLYRDAENFVDLILMVATWASPVLYKW